MAIGDQDVRGEGDSGWDTCWLTVLRRRRWTTGGGGLLALGWIFSLQFFEMGVFGVSTIGT